MNYSQLVKAHILTHGSHIKGVINPMCAREQHWS